MRSCAEHADFRRECLGCRVTRADYMRDYRARRKAAGNPAKGGREYANARTNGG